MLIRFRHLLLLVMLLHGQNSVLLHQLDMDLPEHAGHIQCQLCLHASGLDLTPFKAVVTLTASFLSKEKARNLSTVSALTVFSPVYHGRAPPRANSFIG